MPQMWLRPQIFLVLLPKFPDKTIKDSQYQAQREQQWQRPTKGTRNMAGQQYLKTAMPSCRLSIHKISAAAEWNLGSTHCLTVCCYSPCSAQMFCIPLAMVVIL